MARDARYDILFEPVKLGPLTLNTRTNLHTDDRAGCP